jgi:hypothetical protein
LANPTKTAALAAPKPSPEDWTEYTLLRTATRMGVTRKTRNSATKGRVKA